MLKLCVKFCVIWRSNGDTCLDIFWVCGAFLLAYFMFMMFSRFLVIFRDIILVKKSNFASASECNTTTFLMNFKMSWPSIRIVKTDVFVRFSKIIFLRTLKGNSVFVLKVAFRRCWKSSVFLMTCWSDFHLIFESKIDLFWRKIEKKSSRIWSQKKARQKREKV